jgi:glycosyltransferase involved in cell wall biosynthesis
VKVLHLNQSDLNGGAAIAAYRLHSGLKRLKIDSQLLVYDKLSDDPTVNLPVSKVTRAIAKLSPGLAELPKFLYPQRQATAFSFNWLPDKISHIAKQFEPDIINLHWLGDGYLPINALTRLGIPLVWTLHDMWAFTGGCHYAGECDRYQTACGQCPQLGSYQRWDLSRWIWWQKSTTYPKLTLVIVSPSQWLADCASTSQLLQQVDIRVIPHGINCQKYRPLNQVFARQTLNLPQDKSIVIFGAVAATSDERKGFSSLVKALRKISQTHWKSKIEVAIFGSSEPVQGIDIGFKAHYLGYLRDEVSLTLLYSAGDVMVVPSLQEAYGQTALEAMACGTPVVAFHSTGLVDVVKHRETGYLASPFSPDDLASGISWVLEDHDRQRQLSLNASTMAKESFSLEEQAARYAYLYREILNLENTKI